MAGTSFVSKKQLSIDSKTFHLKYTKELIARKPP